MADRQRPAGRRRLGDVRHLVFNTSALLACVTVAALVGLIAWLSTPRGVALALATPPPVLARPSGWVDVRLATVDEPGALDVGLTGPGRIVVLGDDERSFAIDADVTCLAPTDAAGLRIDGVDLPAAVQLEAADGEAVTVDGRPYRGALQLRRDGDVTRIVNRVPLEHYLLGVVSEEMPRGFGAAALRAQAVAARSWVLARLAEGGTIHPDARSQVYGGLDAETHGSHDAVHATAGLVLTWDGEIAPAWYHSTCGGVSRRAGDVFPGAPDGYLSRIRPCSGCADSPYFEWTRRFDRDAVSRVLDVPPAALRGVSVSGSAADGRARRVDLRVGERVESIHAEDLRIGLSRGRRIREQVLSTLWSEPPVVDDDELVLRGRGWGHGVGLCQYGADGLADDDKTYVEILAHYYPGTRLVALPLVDEVALK